MKILGLDPGKHNFAYALVDRTGVVATGHLPTVTRFDPNDFETEINTFIDTLEPLILQANLVAAERMQSRPGFGAGQVVELMNLMLGLTWATCHTHRIAMYPVMATTWKRHWRTAYGIDKNRFTMVSAKLSIKQPPGSPTKTRTEWVEGVLGERDLTPHQGDAIGIAAYALYRQTKVNLIDHLRSSKCRS